MGRALERIGDPDPTANCGLWLARLATPQVVERGAGADRRVFLSTALSLEPGELYRSAYKRWEETLGSSGRMTLGKARTSGRLILGLGQESVLETSIRLHWTYGTPLIPGTALKGLAARFARIRLGSDWRKGEEGYKVLFGDQALAGYVTFHDAWWIPGSRERPLELDVMAVHHPDYYAGKDAPPADWDEPNPVSFLSAQGAFLVALEGPSEWTAAGMEILQLALREEGIGAKTNAGYGRMELSWPLR